MSASRHAAGSLAVSAATVGTSFARSASNSSESSPLADDPGARGERAIDADVPEVEVQRADARRGERGEEQCDHLRVAADAGLAEELGADLRDLARLADARPSCAARCPRSTGA